MPALLEVLCARINARTAEILREESLSQHERYLKVYQHLEKSDRIVADCFNDWKRSALWLRILFLLKHELLSAEQYEGLSEETRARIAIFRQG